MRAFVIAATCVAVLVTACKQENAPGTVGYWVERLEQPKQRNDALRELGKLGKAEAAPHVVHWFEEDGPWQPSAAYALGMLGDPTAATTLIAKIDYTVGTGRDPLTRRRNRTNLNIARALALLKAKEATQPLIKLLSAPEARVREGVIRALGAIGDERAVQSLAKIAMNDREAFLRKVAVQALGELGSAQGVPTLVRMLYVEVPGISFYNEARYSLIQVGQSAIPTLIETMKRKNTAVEAIRLTDGSPIAEGAIEAKAASVLGALGAVEARDLMVGALTKYYKRFQRREREPVYASVPGAVIELCYALASLGDQSIVNAIMPIAMDTDPNIRTAAVEALTTLGARGSASTLLKAARSGADSARRPAATAASRLGDSALLPSFDSLAQGSLDDFIKHERSRLVAAAECKRDVGCWSKKIGDQDELVRERAAYELGWLGAEQSVDQLLKAAEDDSVQVRTAAIHSLGRMERVDPEKLQTIHDNWKGKMEYAGVNNELRRLIATLRNKQP